VRRRKNFEARHAEEHDFVGQGRLVVIHHRAPLAGAACPGRGVVAADDRDVGQEIERLDVGAEPDANRQAGIDGVLRHGVGDRAERRRPRSGIGIRPGGRHVERVIDGDVGYREGDGPLSSVTRTFVR